MNVVMIMRLLSCVWCVVELFSEIILLLCLFLIVYVEKCLLLLMF